MHIAAADPISLDIQSLNKDVIDKERSIYLEQLKSSGKPENILEKIVEGKIKNSILMFVCLSRLLLLIIKQLLKECIENFNKENSRDLKINSFIMYKLGQD